jgi:hypothetical protein
MPDETSALLRSLALVQAMLADKARELSSSSGGFSGVTYELSIDGPRLVQDYPEAIRTDIGALRARGSRRIVISGYVDATPPGHAGCAWLFYIAEGQTEGWSLDRGITLYPNEGEDVETALPTFDFHRWADVAEALPDLIHELLATPLPAP